MTTILANFSKEFIPCKGYYEDDWGNRREFEGIRVKSWKGKSVFISVIKNEMRMSELRKVMKFEDGKIVIGFGKNKVEIGTYLTR